MSSRSVQMQSQSDVELDKRIQPNLDAQVLHLTGGEWKLEKVDVLKASNLPKTCYIFVDKVKKGYYSKEVQDLVKKHFGTIPEVLFKDPYNDLNGFSGCKPVYDADGHLQSYSTWFRCYVKVLDTSDESSSKVPGYVWYEMTFFTRWDASGDCRVLCFDTPENLPKDLMESLKSDTRNSPDLNPTDPFFLHIPVMDQVLLQYTNSVWRVRNPIRRIEKVRLQSVPDIEAMQEVSRHAIHVGEVLAVTENVLQTILRWQGLVYKPLTEKKEPKISRTYREQMQEYSRFQLGVLRALKGRSDSNIARLHNEINLTHNLIAQSDNQVMKTIAFLGMIFLPATFFSALFSTTFFTFDQSGMQVSKSFWIYWVVTIPSTIIVMLCWRYWLHNRANVSALAQKGRGFFAV